MQKGGGGAVEDLADTPAQKFEQKFSLPFSFVGRREWSGLQRLA